MLLSIIRSMVFQSTFLSREGVGGELLKIVYIGMSGTNGCGLTTFGLKLCIHCRSVWPFGSEIV